MAARSTWKGYLRVSLVTIPVKVFPATESAAALSFNQLHAECQTRIQLKKWCPHCEREVPTSEIVKGYEFEKGRYVVMTEEGFEIDDVHLIAMMHTGAVVLPPLVTVAEGAAKMSGREFLTAAVAGYEVGPRIALCMGNEHVAQGWHSGATFGVFAAAAAAAHHRTARQ